MVPNMEEVCLHFVRLFRKGKLGRLNLDWEEVQDLLSDGGR